MRAVDVDLLTTAICKECIETGFCVGRERCMTMQIIDVQPIIEV